VTRASTSGGAIAGDPAAPLMTWARENLDRPLTVERMAEQASMSADTSPAPSSPKPA
jgi:transcriptional regulator GlxA family with amidase domain